MAVTDLTGTTWVINEQPSVDVNFSYNINFTAIISVETSFNIFEVNNSVSRPIRGLRYHDPQSGYITAYSTFAIAWVSESARTISITGGTDVANTNLIAWLEANATQVVNETYITSDIDLTSVANAIRTKGGTSASLVYPAGYVSAINALPTGALQSYKSAVFTSPGSANLTPDSGYVGIEEISVEYSPAIYDGAYHTEQSGVTDLTGTTWVFNETLSDITPVQEIEGYIALNFYYGDYRDEGNLIPFSFIGGRGNNSSTAEFWGTMDSDWWDTHGDIDILDFTPTSVGNEYAVQFQGDVIPAFNDITFYAQDWPSWGGTDTWFTSNRTITITGGEHATLPQLIAWFEANATQIS